MAPPRGNRKMKKNPFSVSIGDTHCMTPHKNLSELVSIACQFFIFFQSSFHFIIWGSEVLRN